MCVCVCVYVYEYKIEYEYEHQHINKSFKWYTYLPTLSLKNNDKSTIWEKFLNEF